MCKWITSKEDQIGENLDMEELKIFTLPEKSLYHYTSREVFWKIMDTEMLLARHIMFSNDTEENEIGTKKVKQIMEEKNMQTEDTESLPFMVCFCEKKDLLSQWRGYANEGIALEFDFSKGLYGLSGYENKFSPFHCFTIMNNDECKDSGEKYINNFFVLKNGKREQEKFFTGVIAAPYHVFYVDKDTESDSIIKECVDKIISESENELVMQKQRIIKLIPYIKNNKFEEESEYRLIFDMKNLLQGDMQQILEQKYVNLEVSGIRKPNIRVKFGDQMDSEEEKEYSIYYSDDRLYNLLKDMKDELEKGDSDIVLGLFKYKAEVEKNELIISNGKYQAEICTWVRRKLRQSSYSDKEIKIWCDGHLPIRKIIVGPSKDAEYMVNSIKEYIKTKYWMRDIEVEASQIPLRN